ncbi:MAG: hypothetical protein IJ824_04845, partial [Alphaproteobacteria bacterium]|nr:hypothetical protein [Alphaproteobacteria bacterium]
DRNDNDAEDNQEDEDEPEKESVFSRFKLFGRRHNERNENISMADQDPFFKALHNSFQNEPSINEPTFGVAETKFEQEPRLQTEPPLSSFSANENSGANRAPAMNNDFIQGFKSGLSGTEKMSAFGTTSTPSTETFQDAAPLTGLSDFAARLAAVRGEAVQTAGSTFDDNKATITPLSAENPESAATTPSPTASKNDEEEDLVYPFGGWMSEAGNDK